MFILHPHI